MMIDFHEILLVYGLVAALVVAPITAMFNQWFFALIALGSGVFSTVISYVMQLM